MMGGEKGAKTKSRHDRNSYSVILSVAKDLMPVASGDEVLRLRSGRRLRANMPALSGRFHTERGAMASLNNRVAWVTGGSRGIGRAIAISLAEAGAAIAVNYREKAAEARNVVETIRRTGGRGVAVGADVSEAAEVAGMVVA